MDNSGFEPALMTVATQMVTAMGMGMQQRRRMRLLETMWIELSQPQTCRGWPHTVVLFAATLSPKKDGPCESVPCVTRVYSSLPSGGCIFQQISPPPPRAPR